MATLLVVTIDFHCLLGEHLDRPQEAIVAQAGIHGIVLEVDGHSHRRSQSGNVRLETIWHEYCISINFDRPIRCQELTRVQHVVPNVDEDIGVAEGGLPRVPPSLDRLPRVEDVVAVACEDAGLVLFGNVVQADLVRVREEGHETVQRGAHDLRPCSSWPNLVLITATSHNGAVPACWNRNVLSDPSRLLLGLCAGRPSCVLHNAREAHVAAEVRVRARFPSPPAAGCIWCAVSKRPAGPIARRAIRSTTRPCRILLKARHAAASCCCTTALFLTAILPWGRAWIRWAANTKLVARPLRRSEFPAGIVSAFLLSRMDTGLASLLALRPELVLGIALETVSTARLATFGARTICTHSRACRLRERRHHFGIPHCVLFGSDVCRPDKRCRCSDSHGHSANHVPMTPRLFGNLLRVVT
mmetsp:Transcript_18186/g.48482  ORF Transcript_18186/g.48482 Transcript_18186/m.48482 type:complete len:415 (-) Transcript_18186:134-1378(-)